MSEAEIDWEKIEEAALALLSMTRHDGNRVWKSFDWGVMSRLHEKGLITDPVGKAKSVVLTQEGLQDAEAAFDRLFVKRR